MTIKILNAFSLQMLDLNMHQNITVTPIAVDEVKDLLTTFDSISAVGHQDTANVFTDVLGMNIPMNRISVSLGFDDKAIVGQFVGGRLPKGAIELPEGFEIKWVLIEII